MEDKVRRESQTMMEKVFNNYARKGMVRVERVPELLKELNPDLQFTDADIGEFIRSADREGNGMIGLDGFNKIAVPLLIRQTRRDSDQFIHKHDIHIEELPGGFKPPEKEMTWTGPAKIEGMDPFVFKNEIGLEDFPKH